MRLSRGVSLLIILSLFHTGVARGQWNLHGTAVSTSLADQENPLSISDGAGGAIVVWEDNRSVSTDIYVQRINALGVPLWTTNGVAVCSDGFDQYDPQIATDGTGGAIITWFDYRNGTQDIYAQRVNAMGAALWTANGVALCLAANPQQNPSIVTDGAGGAIVTWDDARASFDYDIYAQRVNSLGQVQWAANGVAVCTAVNNQADPVIATDGASGAIVTWFDVRNGTHYDIYAQRINPMGVTMWTANGVALCTAPQMQTGPRIVADGIGGAVVAWDDTRNDTGDIYAQRISGAGTPQWTTNGVRLCGAVNRQSAPALTTDGANGAIVTWTDQRTGVDIYAQRVSPYGIVLWQFDGTAICTDAEQQYWPVLASDGIGGAIVAWLDERNGNFADSYAQHVTSSGLAQWATDGVPLSVTPNLKQSATIVADGNGNAIVAWMDARNGVNNIYAQRVEGVYGYWGYPEPRVTSVADVANDQGGRVALNWTASGRDRPVPATIDFYSVWRAVDVAPFGSSADVELSITPIDRIQLDTPAGVRTKIPSSSYYWELVGSQTAYRLPYYSFSASTRADSVAGNAGDEFFMVMAHDQTDEHIAFASNAVSGHSVDNLAPAAPLLLTAQRVGADVHLDWNGVHVPDLRDYAVYRASSSGVTPVPIHFLASSEDSIAVDAGAPANALYYIVTAYDVHANQSAPSNEASVGAVTGVGNTPSITRLTVLQNHPNPFTGTTEFQIGLPAPSDIRVEVYDVAGRRVHTFEVEQASAGWKQIPFSGRDNSGRPLASGVYFYRVSANGSTVTQKMVIAR